MENLLLPHLQRVFEQLVTGKTNPEIAEALHLKVSTVKSYAEDIYAIFDVSGRRELIKLHGNKEVPLTIRDFSSLTLEEKHFMELLSQGLTNAKIGQKIYRSEDGVKALLRSLTERFGLSRNTLIAAYLAWKQQ